jgi:hypothetical protein
MAASPLSLIVAPKNPAAAPLDWHTRSGMRVRLDDLAHGDDFIGFMQRCRCIVVDQGTGLYEVFLAHDLPERLARAELSAYLSMWKRTMPGSSVALLD